MEDGNVFGRNAASAASMRLAASLDIIRMDDYLVTGTRKQFWQEEFVAAIVSAVNRGELEMKAGARLLGVSYSSLYGRCGGSGKDSQTHQRLNSRACKRLVTITS